MLSNCEVFIAISKRNSHSNLSWHFFKSGHKGVLVNLTLLFLSERRRRICFKFFFLSTIISRNHNKYKVTERGSELMLISHFFQHQVVP